MKRIFALTALVLASFLNGNAQETTNKKPVINLSNRANDHLMIQLSTDTWTGMPDSISSHKKGFSKGFNAYLMIDKPFRSSPKFSVAFGVGYGSSNISFEKMQVDVKSTVNSTLPFRALDSTDHFKKYKLHLGYLEIPVELRFGSNPANPAKSWKVAAGVKVGTMINAHTKGKDLENKNNQVINAFTQKESSKKYFNGTRLMGTARIGYGIFSIFGAYQITNVLKDGAGADMKTVQIGISLSGL